METACRGSAHQVELCNLRWPFKLKIWFYLPTCSEETTLVVTWRKSRAPVPKIGAEKAGGRVGVCVRHLPFDSLPPYLCHKARREQGSGKMVILPHPSTFCGVSPWADPAHSTWPGETQLCGCPKGRGTLTLAKPSSPGTLGRHSLRYCFRISRSHRWNEAGLLLLRA